MPVELNSWGRGFESCRVLGFFLLYPVSSASLIQFPLGGATLMIFVWKNMLSHAAWGKAQSLIRTDWAKMFLFVLQVQKTERILSFQSLKLVKISPFPISAHDKHVSVHCDKARLEQRRVYISHRILESLLSWLQLPKAKLKVSLRIAKSGISHLPLSRKKRKEEIPVLRTVIVETRVAIGFYLSHQCSSRVAQGPFNHWSEDT